MYRYFPNPADCFPCDKTDTFLKTRPGGAKLAGISTMADTRRVMHVWLTPLGDSIKDTVSPIKTWFANDDGTTKTRMNTVDTSFSKEVKRIFA